MSVVIITGSCGLVGSEASFFFNQKGFKVIGIDNNFRKKFFGSEGSTIWIKKKLFNINNYEHFNTDIRNKEALRKIFKKYKNNVKLVIHCAAQPSHDFAKNNSKIDFEVNALGTLNMLSLTEKYCKYAAFIHMSTNKVYGDNPNKLKLKEKKFRWEINEKKYYKGIDEKFSIDNCTHSFFGVSKTYADLIVQEYGKNVGLKTVCFRGGCITGPNHSGAKLHGFLSYLVKISISKKKYSLIGYKGKQVRDNLHSYDLVNSFWEFFKKPTKGEVYNMGGGRFSNCSIIEALDMVEEITNISIQRKILKKPRIGDHIWYISDLSKFKKQYPNWKQKYNTKKIIEDLLRFY